MMIWILAFFAAWLVLAYLMLGFFRSVSRADDQLQAFRLQRSQRETDVADDASVAPKATIANALESAWDGSPGHQTPDRVDG